jgi:hypothetical protein
MTRLLGMARSRAPRATKSRGGIDGDDNVRWSGWLLNGNLLCAARDDGMLARLGRDNEGWALEVPDIVPMISRGRRMHG